MQTYVRLMVLKHRYGWGYETLVREVSDSLIALLLPDPVVRGGAGRVDREQADAAAGAETVAELSRLVIGKAQRVTRFRTRAVRIDSTVVEADVRYPTTRAWRRTGCGRSPGRGSGYGPSSGKRRRRWGLSARFRSAGSRTPPGARRRVAIFAAKEGRALVAQANCGAGRAGLQGSLHR
jgi:transposase, IS5 family